MYLVNQMIKERNILYEKKLIEDDDKSNNTTLPRKIRLTYAGWNRVVQLQSNVTDSKNVFVAMSFDQELNAIYNYGIKAAIEDTNYNPIRVDSEQFNSKICDEIIADIRKSKFVIVDVTNHKNGVYFEAGFAMGLGKPVIWTCREDDINNAHFDTRQYNHILWKNSDELREKLVKRIEATIV